jgi:hypothetical protein
VLRSAALAAKWKEPPRDALDTLVLANSGLDLKTLDVYEQVRAAWRGAPSSVAHKPAELDCPRGRSGPGGVARCGACVCRPHARTPHPQPALRAPRAVCVVCARAGGLPAV